RPSPWRHLAYFAVGLYGGAFQAGVGLLLVLVLQRSGLDLLRANVLKVAVNFSFTALALPVFIWNDRVAWIPALALGAGYALGGEIGARLTIGKGERVLKPA
ncbi:MAG: TSUP family transporter, partial [Gammaproteobacteria bacterium]|nr:TSUP family transporter [Gammaproteobacteria bacterium]